MSTLSGLSIYARQQALATVLPNATDVWVGLVTALPSVSDGTGLEEADTATGYARVPHDAWLNTTDGDEVYRSNDGTVVFDELTGVLVGVVGWAIWDDEVAGNLIAFGPMVDEDDNEVTEDFVSGAAPVIADQELRVTIGEP